MASAAAYSARDGKQITLKLAHEALGFEICAVDINDAFLGAQRITLVKSRLSHPVPILSPTAWREVTPGEYQQVFTDAESEHDGLTTALILLQLAEWGIVPLIGFSPFLWQAFRLKRKIVKSIPTQYAHHSSISSTVPRVGRRNFRAQRARVRGPRI
jgi:hypothetical protein